MPISTASSWDSNGGAVPAIALGTEANESYSHQACWYAVQTRLRFEKKTQSNLQDKGIETFFPVVKRIHPWTDRNKLVETPLFPGYGFIHLEMSPGIRLQVLQTSGVVNMVGAHGRPCSVPKTQIDALRCLLQNDVDFALHPFLRAGQRIRIRGGALDGLEGILDQTAGRRLVVSIDSLQRSLTIRVEGYQIELA